MELFIISTIHFALRMYMFLIIAYSLQSWIPILRDSMAGEYIRRLVEPFLQPFRQLIPPVGMIDISAIIALFTLYLADEGVRYLLHLIFRGFV